MNNNEQNNKQNSQGLSDYVNSFRKEDTTPEPQQNVYFRTMPAQQNPNPQNPASSPDILRKSDLPINPRNSSSSKIIVLILLAALGIAAYIFSGSDSTGPTNNIGTASNIYVNPNMGAHDYEIAKKLFKAYLGAVFDEKHISDAGYDEETKEFSCKYILKVHDDKNEDTIFITTKNFNDYLINTSTYISEDNYDTSSSNFKTLPNNIKNEIRAIASQNKYEIAGNLTNTEYEELLDILFEDDFANLSNIAMGSRFKLEHYYYEKAYKRVTYLFTGSTNSNLSIRLECTIGSSSKCEILASSPDLSAIMPSSNDDRIEMNLDDDIYTVEYTYSLSLSTKNAAKKYTDRLFE